MAADDLMETVNASFGTTGKRVDVASARASPPDVLRCRASF
jgi:hypothetical protein